MVAVEVEVYNEITHFIQVELYTYSQCISVFLWNRIYIIAKSTEANISAK